MSHDHNSFLAKSRNNFFAGVAVLLPAVGTILIVQFLVVNVNTALLDPILQFIAPAVQWADKKIIAAVLKVVMFVLILGSISILGFLVKNFFIRSILKFGETIVMKVPLVNKIYSSIQQISGSFLMRKKEMFNKVVIVEYPRRGIFILALVSSECDGVVTRYLPSNCVNVFVPTTPNPTSGFLIMVPQDQLIEVPISVEDALKLIISGGVVTANEISKKVPKGSS